jgi:hypothetical protein
VNADSGIGVRFSFTLTMLVGIGLGALAGGVWLADFPKLALGELGFSAGDLASGMVARLFTSAFVTHGGWVAVRAVLFTGVLVGLAERERGTVVTAATFWGSHLAVLAVLAVALIALSRLGLASELATTRDLGPSAGYMGCLGLLTARRGPWRTVLRVTVLAILVVLFWVDPPLPISAGADRLADVAHLMSFALGFALGWILDRRARTLDQAVPASCWWRSR